MNNLNVALALAAAGIPVFPAVLKKKKDGSGWDKIPAVAKGQNWKDAATTDQDQIRAWWRERPDCVPGIPLGRIGLLALDPDRHQGADAPDGMANFAELVRRIGGIPPHPVTSTASGGEHHIFGQPPGGPLGNGEGDLPDGINVRGVGGWLVAPGAMRPDGAMWQTKPGTPSLIDAFVSGSIPVIPDSLVAIIGQPTGKRSKPARNPEHFPAYLRERKNPVLCLRALAALAPEGKKKWARKKLESSANELAATPKGARGSTLNALSYSMGRVVARGWVRRGAVFDALWAACEINGLIEFDGPKKVQSAIDRGIEAGICNPREDLPALPAEKKTPPHETSRGPTDQRGNPTLPHGFANRVAANWSLPLAIADAAGGEWPEKARAAAALVAKVKATLDASIGIQLLSDIRAAFGNGTERLFSATLIDKLTADPEGPWATYNRGKSFTQKQLANRLRDYGIVSETIWIDNKSAKGYRGAAFEDVWTRYLSE